MGPLGTGSNQLVVYDRTPFDRALSYIIRAMTAPRNQVRDEVLAFLREQPEPVRMNIMAAALRDRNPQLRDLRDSDFRDVVQPMIVTGKVHYTAGLKVRLGDERA